MTLTLFTFGYWGWGNAVPELVRAVDAVEARRGFEPPVFVDLRWHRSVRARGFHGDALAETVGRDRHAWMRKLGNRKIVGRVGDEIEIAEPAAVETLLDSAIENAERGRRLIAFCACPLPFDRGRATCHRRTVAELLLGAARSRGVALRVVEWPGESPDAIEPIPELEVSDALLRAVARGRQTIPTPEPRAMLEFAGYPWGGVIELRSPGARRAIVSRPAIYSRGWCVPALVVPPDGSVGTARAAGAAYRRDFGFDPLETG